MKYRPWKAPSRAFQPRLTSLPSPAKRGKCPLHTMSSFAFSINRRHFATLRFLSSRPLPFLPPFQILLLLLSSSYSFSRLTPTFIFVSFPTLLFLPSHLHALRTSPSSYPYFFVLLFPSHIFHVFSLISYPYHLPHLPLSPFPSSCYILYVFSLLSQPHFPHFLPLPPFSPSLSFPPRPPLLLSTSLSFTSSFTSPSFHLPPHPPRLVFLHLNAPFPSSPCPSSSRSLPRCSPLLRITNFPSSFLPCWKEKTFVFFSFRDTSKYIQISPAKHQRKRIHPWQMGRGRRLVIL